MIESIRIQNFKSYRNASLRLAPLTLMVGANASGKSNALEAIRFLSWMAQGHKLNSLQFLVNDTDRVVRGRVSDLMMHEQKEFSIGCTLSSIDESFRQLDMAVSIRQNEEIHIQSESVSDPDSSGYNFLYRSVTPSVGTQTQMSVEYNNFARGGKKPQIPCSDQMAAFIQLGAAARFADSHEKAKRLIPEVCGTFESQIANILFLDPVPQKMRGYAFLNDKRLQGDGGNLSAVLHHLWNSAEEGQYFRDTILAFISSLPEQDILGIEFLTGPRGEVMLQLKESFGGNPRLCDASLLSDGTLRVLALVAALLFAPEGSMVIVEEVDNGVHPSRVNRLLEKMDEIARKRNLTILISSHNPAMLDAMPDKAVPDIVFCYRNPQTGFSELTRIQDLPFYPELILQGALGSLLTKGRLDRFVKQAQDAEEKKQQAKDWVHSLRNTI